MAIIYTYPPVTNPDGTELIVVSETKNKNSTRLITLAGICEFCDDTYGCDHSFRYIQTSSVTRGEAVGCNDELKFISSDATIDITNSGNEVDFKGASGCPTTYVLKPTTCNEEDECVVSEIPQEWLFTCDPSFAGLVPGYVTITNNGTPVVTDFGECWYAEFWAPVATGTTCEICCEDPQDQVLTLTICGDQPPDPIQTLQSNISGPAGWESAIDDECKFAQATIDAYFWDCIKITTGGVNTDTMVSLDAITTIAEPCTCECCIHPCSFELTPCDGVYPPEFDTYIGVPITAQDQELCEFLETGDYVYIQLPSEAEWCFQITKVCQEYHHTLPISGVDDCNQQICPGSGVQTLRFRKCETGQGPSPWRYESALDPVPAPFDAGGVFSLSDTSPGQPCVDGSCCIEVESTALSGTEDGWTTWINPCDPNFQTSFTDCDCCQYQNVVQYDTCEPGACLVEGYPSIWVDVCNWSTSIFGIPTWEHSTAPDFIKVEISPGNFCCYEKNAELPCIEEDMGPVGYSELTYDELWDDCTCGEIPEVYAKYNNCADPAADKWASATGTPGSDSWVVGQIILHGGNCYEVLENPSIPTGSIVDIPGYIAYAYPEVDCNCCNEGPNRRYTRCSSEESIVVDPSTWGSLNQYGIDGQIKVEFVANPGVYICYEFYECTTDPQTAGIGDVDISTGCADPSCDVFVELQSCFDGTTAKIAVGNFSPAITFIAGDVIEITSGTLAPTDPTCWDVINLNAPGPETHTGVQNWNGPIAASTVDSTTACECCEQDLRIYTICDGEPGDSCNLALSNAILVDVSLVPGWDAVTYQNIVGEETAVGFQCCYVLNVELPSCQAPTGTIINTVVDCDDALCTADEE